MLPEPPRCAFPGCPEWGDHKHHIVYRPEPVIRRLCFRHHEEITHLNGQQSRKYGWIVLSNTFRWRIWHRWLRGELKPRRTRKALEYTESWKRAGDGFEETPEPKKAKKRLAFVFQRPAPAEETGTLAAESKPMKRRPRRKKVGKGRNRKGGKPDRRKARKRLRPGRKRRV